MKWDVLRLPSLLDLILLAQNFFKGFFGAQYEVTKTVKATVKCQGVFSVPPMRSELRISLEINH